MRFEYAELGECILSLVAIENAKKLGLSTEKRIALFDPVNGAVSHTMTSDQGRVESLCSAGLSFGSELVFFIVQEKCAGFWDSRDSKQSGLTSIICKYDGDSVEEEGFSCGSISGTFAVLGDNKGDIKIFDIRNSNHPLGIIEGMHTDSVRALEFHPSASSMLFSSSADGLINKYDLNAPTVDESLSSGEFHFSIKDIH